MEAECLVDHIRLRAHAHLECPHRLRLDVEHAHHDRAAWERHRRRNRGRRGRGRQPDVGRTRATAIVGLRLDGSRRGVERHLAVLPPLILDRDVHELLRLQPELAPVEQQVLLDGRGQPVERLERSPLVHRVHERQVGERIVPLNRKGVRLRVRIAEGQLNQLGGAVRREDVPRKRRLVGEQEAKPLLPVALTIRLGRAQRALLKLQPRTRERVLVAHAHLERASHGAGAAPCAEHRTEALRRARKRAASLRMHA